MLPLSYNFPIVADGKVSTAFREQGCVDFSEAIKLITELPYGRNIDKENLLTIFTDGCATCSTKHALLKQLADENSAGGIQLILCIFKMSRENTPSIKQVLDKYALPYMPEAHNYLRVGGEVVDCTKQHWSILGFFEDVLEEQEIGVADIIDYKAGFHKKYLSGWLKKHPEISYFSEELYEIREECIQALGAKS